MCVSPIAIKNPLYGSEYGYDFLKDTSHSHLLVPCGHCDECIRNRQFGYMQRAMVESIYAWPFAIMISYNEEHLPRVTASDGKHFRYANWKHLQDMFKRLRIHNSFGRNFTYLAVSEFGGKRHRPHFHLLLFLEKLPGDHPDYTPFNLWSLVFKEVLKHWSVNVGSDKNPVYESLLTYRVSRTAAGIRRNYDVQYCDPKLYNGEPMSGVAMYFQKYMLKGDDYVKRLHCALKLNYEPEEAALLWKIIRPRSSRSLGFGLADFSGKRSPVPNPAVLDRIKSYISLSRSSGSYFPMFFIPSNGKSLPLSRYYRSRFETIDDRLGFILNSNPDALDGSLDLERKDMSEIDRDLEKGRKRFKTVSSRDDVLDFMYDEDTEDVPQVYSVSQLRYDSSLDLPFEDLVDNFHSKSK